MPVDLQGEARDYRDIQGLGAYMGIGLNSL